MLLELGDDLLVHILRCLPPRCEPLGRLSCTSKALRRMTSASALWRRLAHSIFPAAELHAAYPTGAPQWREASRQLLFEQARSSRWKARQRLEEVHVCQTAWVDKLGGLEVKIGRMEASLRRPGTIPTALREHLADITRAHREVERQLTACRCEVEAREGVLAEAGRECALLTAAARTRSRASLTQLRHRHLPQFPAAEEVGVASARSSSSATRVALPSRRRSGRRLSDD